MTEMSSKSLVEKDESDKNAEGNDDAPPAPLLTPVETALTTELVVIKLFRYLKLSDIKACRNVCQLWNNLARPFMQKLSKVYFPCKKGTLGDFKTLINNSASMYLPSTNFGFRCRLNKEASLFCKKFEAVITSLEFVFMINFSIISLTYGECSMNDFAEFLHTTEFLILEELTLLSHIQQPSLEEAPSTFTLLLSEVSLQSMKTLSVVGKFSDVNMLALMRAFPNLQSIQVCRRNWDLLLKCMEDIENTSRNRIRRIDSCSAKLDKESLQKLIALNLKLSHLTLYDDTDEMNEGDARLFVHLIEELLKQQRESLKKFIVPRIRTVDRAERIWSIDFPIMESLEELHLGYRIICCINSFATCLPRLQKYKCEFHPEDSFSIRTTNPAPCHTLTHLIDIFASNLNVIQFTQLYRHFPNVTNLKLNCPNNAVIRCLWTLWPGLKELKILGALKWSVFTGFSESESIAIQTNRRYQRVNLKAFRSRPSIRNLTNLMSLTLDNIKSGRTQLYAWNHDGQIETPVNSDTLAYLGISTLKQLRELKISGVPISLHQGISGLQWTREFKVDSHFCVDRGDFVVSTSPHSVGQTLLYHFEDNSIVKNDLPSDHVWRNLDWKGFAGTFT